MGILSFLSKKTSSEVAPKPCFKSQAYELTLASEPPIRGTKPGAGNGSVLETIQKAHAKQSQTSLLQADTAAPPVMPRPAANTPERPRTAHFVDTTEADPSRAAQQPKDAPNPPPHTFRRPPPLKRVPRRVDNSILTPPSPGLGPPLSPSLEPPRSPFLRQRSDSRAASIQGGSARSEGGRGFVDILDAHSALNPFNFRARVKASGARDYGEDVADRNLGENGVDLTSARARAFSALPAASLYGEAERPATSMSTRANGGVEGADRQAQKYSLADSPPRTKSLNSSLPPPPSMKRASVVPPVPSLDARELTAAAEMPSGARASRRRSLSAYAPNASSDLSGASRKPRPAGFSRGGASANDRTLGSARDQAHHRPSMSRDTITQSDDSAVKLHVSSPNQKPNTSSKLAHRDSVALSKKRERKRRGVHAMYPDNDSSFSDQSQSTERPPSLGLPSHRGPLTGSVPSRHHHPSKMQSLQAARPSASESYSSRDFAGEYPPLPFPTNRPRTSHGHDRVSSSGGMSIGGRSASAVLESTQPPRSSHSRDSSRGLVSSPGGKGRLDEIFEHVPMRSSSRLRHWSITSTTPTTSDASSNPFRPQSRHTANTSIDLGIHVPSSKTSRHNSLSSSAAEGHMTASSDPRSHSRTPSSRKEGSDMDGYVSSDNDSHDTPRHSRGDVEEGLLFSEAGYGFDGALPGLIDAAEATIHPSSSSISSGISSSMTYSPRMSSSLPSGDLHHAYTSPFSPPPLPRRYILDTAADYDSGEDESQSEPGQYYCDMDQGPRQPYSVPYPHQREAKQMHATGGSPQVNEQRPRTHDTIKEERFHRSDISDAVRARKEAKSRRRAGSAPRSRSKTRTGTVALAVDDGDEGNNADVE